MFARSQFWSRGVGVVVMLSLAVGVAAADDSSLTLRPVTVQEDLTAVGGVALMSMQDDPVSERTDITIAEESTGKLMSFNISYALYSDYVWRGINLSEYRGEGREKPNHQLDVSVGVDLGLLFDREAGSLGTFKVGTWFEWYGDQKKLNPDGGGQNLQEVDYNLTWSYDIESIATTFSLGYIFYTFPNAKQANTQEWWFSLAHNDAWLWKGLWPDNEAGVLNPSFGFYQDVALGAGSSMFMTFGLNHPFEVAPDFTITPSWTLCIDHGFTHYFGGVRDHSTRIAGMLWGLDMTYDLTEALRIPDGWGSVSLSGFLYFCDAVGNMEDNGVIQDEFYGGMSIGWSF